MTRDWVSHCQVIYNSFASIEWAPFGGLSCVLLLSLTLLLLLLLLVAVAVASWSLNWQHHWAFMRAIDQVGAKPQPHRHPTTTSKMHLRSSAVTKYPSFVCSQLTHILRKCISPMSQCRKTFIGVFYIHFNSNSYDSLMKVRNFSFLSTYFIQIWHLTLLVKNILNFFIWLIFNFFIYYS